MANLGNSHGKKSDPITTDIPRERTPCCGTDGHRVWFSTYLVTDPDGPMPTAAATPTGDFTGCSLCHLPVGVLRMRQGFPFMDADLWRAMLARVKTHGPSAYFYVKIDGRLILYDWSRNKMVKRLSMSSDAIAAAAKLTRTPFKESFTSKKNEAIVEKLPVAMQQEAASESARDDSEGVEADEIDEPF